MALFLFYFILFYFFCSFALFCFFCGSEWNRPPVLCPIWQSNQITDPKLSLINGKKNWRLVQMWVHANHNYVRVLCSWKSRATTERNASYLRYLEITGKNFPYLRLLATKAHLSNVFAVRAAIISVSSISLPHNINICRIFAER